MQDLIDQILTPEVRMVLYLLVVCVVMLYVLSIVYVIRDAQRRGAEPWWMWAIISVIPIVGLLAYVILRPSSYLIDREEQDLDIALREHQLSHYGICPKCGAPIDRDFVVCPICNTQVRNVCPTCPRPGAHLRGWGALNLRSGAKPAPEGPLWQQVRTKPLLGRQNGAGRPISYGIPSETPARASISRRNANLRSKRPQPRV